ncbi:MAG: hypothetical protein ABIZ80_21885 [Bryobacteraceae bacterium]
MKLYIPCILALAGLTMGQQTSQKKDSPQQQKEPAPLFGGKLGGRSSQKTKESATLGFNGIDPSGKVDRRMLAAAPGAKEQQLVATLSANRPTAAELAAFIAEGGLRQK